MQGSQRTQDWNHASLSSEPPSPVSFAISFPGTNWVPNKYVKDKLKLINSQHRLPSQHLVLNLTSTAREKVAGAGNTPSHSPDVLYLLLGSIPSLSSQ